MSMRPNVKEGDRVDYVVHREYRGTVVSRQGEVLMVELDDPKCVVQILRSDVTRAGTTNNPELPRT